MPAQSTLHVPSADGSEQRHAQTSAPLSANPDAAVPYEFGQEIARGGMGSILEAADCKLGRTVAVKIMLAEMDADEDQRQRFINEAAVLATLEHPNIVPIHDLGRDTEGQLYYTMKLVHGRTLQAILNGIRNGDAATVSHYTLDRLLTVFRKVCDALAFAHSRKIIHRDLKPENIMVGEFGEVLVMDWGLAKTLNAAPRSSEATVQAPPQNLDMSLQETLPARTMPQSALGVTMEGAVMGTPQYMSPEQAEGRIGDMDARSDIFSLGGILYAILTLRPPVEGNTLDEVLQKVASGNITPPSRFGANMGNGSRAANSEVLEAQKIKPLPHCPSGRVPAALSAVVMKSLTVQRERRYPSVTTFSADVEAYQNGFATSAENARAWKLFTLFLKRHKVASMGVAAVLLVGATLGTKAIIEGRRAEREAVRANGALADLKKSAPSMLALAESEAVAQHFESALEKTDATLRLDPDLLPAYWRRAWGLVALGRFSDAATALRTASERDPANARQLRAILPHIEKIASIPGEAERYAPDMLTPVFEFLEVHGARGEAGALIEHLRLTNAERFTIARERLKALGGAEAALSQLPSGLIVMDYVATKLKSLEQMRGIPCDFLKANSANIESLEPLRGLRLSKLDLLRNRISDLAPLRGMALVEMDLYYNAALSDLTPLAGMPLRKLSLYFCQSLGDISPLHGMPLEELHLGFTAVSDIRPLAGMPLGILSLNGSAVTDLSPLAGLPLKELQIKQCVRLKDLTPLLSILTLERLWIDAPAEVLAPLRQHPKLAFINYQQQKGYRPAAEVWAELDAQKGAGAK